MIALRRPMGRFMLLSGPGADAAHSTPVAGADDVPGVGAGVVPASCRRMRTPGRAVFVGGEVALCILAGLALAMLFYVAWARVRYPFSLEWCESGIANGARRVLQGLPLYAAPSVEYTCYQYTPFYYYLCAVSFLIFGAGLPAARFVSLLFFVGNIVMIFRIVQRETGRRVWGFIAAGLFAALCDAVSCWFVLVRVDMPHVFFFLAALYVARFGTRTMRDGFSVGALLFLSFFTKQSALVMALPFLAYLVAAEWRKGVAAACVFTALVGGSTALLTWATHGWYFFYTYTLLSQHGRASIVSKVFWRDDLWNVLPIASLGVLVFLLTLVFHRDRKRNCFYVAAMAGVLLSGWSSRLHEGSAINSSLPTHAMLVILAAMATWNALQWARRFYAHAGPGLAIGLYVLFAIQFCLLAYDPRIWIRPATDVEAGRKLVEIIRGVDGEVFIPHHGILALEAGKRCYADGVATTDLFRGKDEELKRTLSSSLSDAFRSGRFAVVILDNKKIYPGLMGTSYTKVPASIFKDPRAFKSRDRWDSRPTDIYVHQDAMKDFDRIRRSLPVQ